MESEHVIFSLLKKVSHTQKATIKFLEKEIGCLSTYQKEALLMLKDSQDGFTPLIWAAKNGSDELIQYFVELISNKFPPPFILDQTGGWNESTALIKAAEYNHINAVSVLIELKANLNIQNDFGSTAIMLAAEKGHLEIVQKLAGCSANLNIQNKLGYTPLILAAEKGHHDILKILCKAGADKAISNQFGKTALIMAAECNQIECVKALFDETVIVDENLETSSDMDGHHTNFDPKINHQSHRGMTALMLAAVKGNEDVVNLLLERKADTTLKCKSHLFALTYSFISGNEAIVKSLLSRPMPKELKNKNGCTPFMLAAESGNLKILKLLLLRENREKIYTITKDSSTPRLLVNSLIRNDLVNSLIRYDRHREGKDQIENMCIETAEDGSTSLHLAAAKGHITVLVFLMDRAPEALAIKNKQGKTFTQLLAAYYIDNESKFPQFIHEASKNMNLLELLPQILPKFKSPNTVLNECFGQVLMAFRENEELNIVTNLVNLSVGLKLAMDASPLEAADLSERLDFVQDMLQKCMDMQTMDNDRNVLLVMEDRHVRNRDDWADNLHRARAFIRGPLRLCLKHEFLPILGTRQLSVFVDGVFNQSLRVKKLRPLEALGDVFQIRSNCINWRTNPAFNFYFEGFCKFITMGIVSVLLWQHAPYTRDQFLPNYGLDKFRKLAITLEVIVLASIFSEFGKLVSVKFNLKKYFMEMWVYLDVATLVFLIAWTALTLQDNNNTSYALSADQYANVTATSITDSFIPQPPGKPLLAFSAVLMSLGQLRYMSTSVGIGHYVLMVMAMVYDLRNFLIVFLIATAGFAIALHGLFPYLNDYRSVERTMFQLFVAILGQFDPTFVFENDPNEVSGYILYVFYITLSGIILINIIIATFAAMHDEIRDQSKENWSYMKACYVQQFLLVFEKNPLCMLPAPFNLISALFSIFHFGYIHIRKSRQQATELSCAETYEQDPFPDEMMTTPAENSRTSIGRQRTSTHELSPPKRTSLSRKNSSMKGMKKAYLNSSASEECKSTDLPSSSSVLPLLRGLTTKETNISFKGQSISPELEKANIPESKGGHTRNVSKDHTCCCPCKDTDMRNINNHGSPFLSISGTASDITLGLLLLFPCAIYEIYLCLDEIRKYQKKKDYFWKCLAVTIICFPFFYFGFVITLLIEIAHVRTLLVLNEGDKVEVHYDGDKIPPESTHDVTKDSSKQYICLSIKLIRAELSDRKSLIGSQLSRTANIYAVLTVGHQVLVTQPVECIDKKPLFRDAKKDFIFCMADEDKLDKLVRVELFDDERFLGSCQESYTKWIANGRFEGSLELHLDSKKVGTIFLTAQVPDSKKSHREPIRLTSVMTEISRCVLMEKKPFSSKAQYFIRLSLAENNIQSPLTSCDGTVIKFDKLLCLSTSSSPSEKFKDNILTIELVKLTSNEDSVLLAKCVTTTDWLAHEEFDGQLEMFDGLKCVCRIELTAYVTDEITTIRVQTAAYPTPADASLITLNMLESHNADAVDEVAEKHGVSSNLHRTGDDIQTESAHFKLHKMQESHNADAVYKVAEKHGVSSNLHRTGDDSHVKSTHFKLRSGICATVFATERPLAKCTCGKPVRHSCRSMKNRTGRLFDDDDLETIFLGVEPNQHCINKSKFIYELRQEIRRGQVKDRRHDELNDNVNSLQKDLNKLRDDMQKNLNSISKTVHDVMEKLEKQSTSGNATKA